MGFMTITHTLQFYTANCSFSASVIVICIMYSLLQTAYLYATNCTVVHCILYSLIQNVQLYTANCIVVRYKIYNCTLQTVQLFTISTYDLHSEPIIIIVFFSIHIQRSMIVEYTLNKLITGWKCNILL